MTAAASDNLGFIPAFPARHERRLPLLQLLKTLRENAIGTYTQDAFERDIIIYRLGFKPMILANHPDLIRHVMLDNAANYERDPVGKRLLEPGLGKGLLTSEGAEWKRQRRMMAPIFQPRRLAGFAAIMTDYSERLARKLAALPPTCHVDMAEQMMLLTLDVIARTMFGSDDGTDVSAVGEAMDRYQATVRPNIPDLIGLPRWVPRPAAAEGQRALAEMDAIINGLIQRRRERAELGNDLLGLLLAARDDETGAALDDREVRDQMATFFLAGHETTATTLAWTWYLLSHAPQVEAKLHAELDTVLGGRAATNADYDKLIYTRMVLEEAMRLYPPAHTTARQAMAEDRFGDIAIPPGTMVIISPYIMHRHRLYWQNPDAFDPENFAPEKAAQRRRYTYLPFGAGPRICIGQGFAMIEAVLILATLAQKLRARLVPGAKVAPVAKITLRPSPGLPMTIQPR
ncbi:cytochrome P450 [Ferrovibrio terrae]|uniref:Cytochrome P450 n=1 Tax=Ferrovibrio terrae TaxID=2594003 RepID=A0A516H3L0_9PROT|nr:cytochrome P450 [Ferrovibrio terrae]QDO98362.1 cytochrome P450 [Ferrovibrio terrae]